VISYKANLKHIFVALIKLMLGIGWLSNNVFLLSTFGGDIDFGGLPSVVQAYYSVRVITFCLDPPNNFFIPPNHPSRFVPCTKLVIN